MISGIIFFLTGKRLVLFNRHRNSVPLLQLPEAHAYYFLSPWPIWKLTAIVGRSAKRRYWLMALFLNFINPHHIVDINWITRLHTLYFVWCRKNSKKFIVIQHGTYVAGIVTDIPHRIVKCQVFLVWSQYWKELFLKYNSGRRFECIVYGNPVFNSIDRSQYQYDTRPSGKKVLLAPSLMQDDRYTMTQQLIDLLEKIGYELYLKEHPYQGSWYKLLTCNRKVSGSMMDHLISRQYDFVITDVSTAMNEIIFTKNNAVFFSPPGKYDYYVENLYSRYCRNLALELDQLQNAGDLAQFVDVNRQEQLLGDIAVLQNNNLKFLESVE